MSLFGDKDPEVDSSLPGTLGVAAETGPLPTDPAVLECLALLKESFDELLLLVAANNDAVAIATLIAQVQALCDKFNNQLGQNLDILTELQFLCEKILKGNEIQVDVSEQLAELCEKLNAVIVDCPVDTIPGADYESAVAWVTGRPITNVVWKLIDNRNPLAQVTVASGNDFNSFIAAMELLGYQEWSFGETHYFCPCPPDLVNPGDYFVTADGNTVSKLACLPSAEVPEFPDKVQPEPVKALQVKEVNSAALLAAMETAVEKLCALDSSKVDCQNCALFVIDADTIVDNVITGVQGSSGSIEPLSEPATGPDEFAAAIKALGYAVDSVSGNNVTVCGDNLIFSYQQQDGAVVPASDFFAKQGTLVCDPAGNAALCAKLEKNNSLQEQTLGVMQELLACWKIGNCEPQAEGCPPALTITSEAGEGFAWSTGPDAGQLVNYPTPIDTPETQDIIGTVSVDCEALNACEAYAKCTSLRLRVTYEHRQLGPNHTGFISVLAGGTAVAVSPSNTTAVASNAANQQIGTASGDPDDTGYVMRWVDYMIPKDDVCAGVQLATGGFQGFDTGGVFDESFNSISVTIEGCE